MGSMCVDVSPRFSTQEALAQSRPTAVITPMARRVSPVDGCDDLGWSFVPL